MKTLIKNETVQKSLEISYEILRHSSRISNLLNNLKPELKVEDIYVEREQYLQELVGEQGCSMFHPLVSQDLVKDFISAFPNQDNGMPSYMSEIAEKHAERVLCRYVFEYMKVDNLLNNTVPEAVKILIQKNKDELKSYNSPKLSKLLVKLWGEKADIVKWYTNKCPKALTKGELKDYTITLSVLPHHITGMSYYSPVNHGGDKWINGWEGSSCMDTIRNSGGDNIVKLLPNLSDSFLAIAYLSKTNDNDILNPKYLSRTLVRIANVEGKWIMVGLRTYSISNEAQTILIDGLRNQFDNFISVYDIREKYGRDMEETWKTKVIINNCNVLMHIEERHECSRCEGTGNIEDNDECYRCDGDGVRISNYNLTPYIDDSDIFGVKTNGKVRVNLPIQMLMDKGFLENDALEKAKAERDARMNGDNLVFAF